MRTKLFIIGAGANKQTEYYPTGKELFIKIKNHYVDLRLKYSYNDNLDHSIEEAAKEFLNNNQYGGLKILRSQLLGISNKNLKLECFLYFLVMIHNPDSIDYFIQNLESLWLKEYSAEIKIECESIQKIAEEIIADILLQIREKTKIDTKCKIQYNYFYKILQKLEPKLENTSVSIINFNYDTNLEEVFDYFINVRNKNHNPEHYKKLKKLEEIIKNSHVYGDIDNGIKFINRLDNKTDEYLQKFIESDDVYFLGFGFDEINMINLGLDQIKDSINTMRMAALDKNDKFSYIKKKKIYITSYAGNVYGENNIYDTRRFAPRITSIIEEFFAVDEIKESYNSNFFLKGKSAEFRFINSEDNQDYGCFEIFISGLSVEKAIEEDFLI